MEFTENFHVKKLIAMEKSLQNHLILDNIGSHLRNGEDLKSARSVCKFWYKIISPKLVLNLKYRKYANSLIRFHSKKTKETDLGVFPYKKFSFFEELSVLYENENDYSWVPLFFKKLSNNVINISNYNLQVREISLLSMPTRKIISLLQIVGQTLEYLELKDLHYHFMKITRDDNSTGENEHLDLDLANNIKMLNLRHIYFNSIRTYQIILGSHLHQILIQYQILLDIFLDQLLCCAPYLEKVTIAKSHKTKIILSILNAILKADLKHLKILKIEKILDEISIGKLIELANAKKIDKIILEKYENYFNSDSLVKFFRILSLYFPDVLPTIQKEAKTRENYYKNCQIKSWTKISLPFILDKMVLGFSLDKIFYHFPEIEEMKMNTLLYITEALDELVENYPKVKKLDIFEDHLFDITPGESFTFLTDILPHFPNLKVLTFSSQYVKNYQKGFLRAIFQNLSLLEELSIDFTTLNYVNYDAEITGIPDSKLIGYREETSYNVLKECGLQNFEDKFPAISNLTRLKKLDLGLEGISEMSIFFGFRQLPILKILYLPKMTIKREYQRIFCEEFPMLRELKLKNLIAEWSSLTSSIKIAIKVSLP